MILKPTIDQLNEIDMGSLEKLLAPRRVNDGYFRRPPGVEHYRLLAWMSTQFTHSFITEVGTLDGMGLVALSYNPINQVVSWDIKDCEWKGRVPMNGERKIVHEGWMDEVFKSTLIFYDGAHQGEDEQSFLVELMKRGWHGTLVYDDIYLNDEMKHFWKNIPLEKHDWTDIGHSYGTGVIFL